MIFQIFLIYHTIRSIMYIYCLFVNFSSDEVAPMATFVFNEAPSCLQVAERVGGYIKRNSAEFAEYIASGFYDDYEFDSESPIHQILESYIHDDTDDTNDTDDPETDHQTASIKYLIDELTAEEAYKFFIQNRQKWDYQIGLINITNTITN